VSSAWRKARAGAAHQPRRAAKIAHLPAAGLRAHRDDLCRTTGPRTPVPNHPDATPCLRRRPGYQGQVSLFLAPPAYVLRDYLTWSDSGGINAEQLAFLRPKIHDTIDYTWADLAACASATNNASNVQAGTAPRMSQVGHPARLPLSCASGLAGALRPSQQVVVVGQAAST
jgi:hypothetical protein